MYQRIVAVYRNLDRAGATTDLAEVIIVVSTAVPIALTELITPGHCGRPRFMSGDSDAVEAFVSSSPRKAWRGTKQRLPIADSPELEEF